MKNENVDDYVIPSFVPSESLSRISRHSPTSVYHVLPRSDYLLHDNHPYTALNDADSSIPVRPQISEHLRK